MPSDRSRCVPSGFPVAAKNLLTKLYIVSLVLAFAAIFLLPFGTTRTLSVMLSTIAGFLVLSGVLASTIGTDRF